MMNRHWRRAEVLRHWSFWMMAPAVLGPSAFITALFFQQVHLAGLKGWAHVELVALIPIYTVLAIAANFLSGAALDRFGTTRLLPFVYLPLAAGFATMGLTSSYMSGAIAMALIGVAQGGLHTLMAAFWAELFGTKHLGAIKALGTALMVLGSAIGPALTGVLIDLGLSFETQLALIGLYFLAISGLVGIAMRWARPLLPAAAEIDVIRP